MQNRTAQFFIDFMQAYKDAWNHFDVDGIIAFYHMPCFIFKNGQVYSNPTEKSRQKYFTDLLADYRIQGYAKAEIPNMEVKKLGRNSSLVSVNWLCKKEDGTVVFDFWDSYQVVLMDGKWAILNDTVHDE